MTQFLYFKTDYLNKVRRTFKNVIKSEIIKNDIEFKTQSKKLKAKNQRCRNIKPKHRKKKPSFPKEQVKYVDIYKLGLNKAITSCK